MVIKLAHQLWNRANDDKLLGGDNRQIKIATPDALCDINAKECIALDIA